MDPIIIALSTTVILLLLLLIYSISKRSSQNLDSPGLQGLFHNLETKIAEGAAGVRERFLEDIKSLEKEVSNLSARLEEQREAYSSLKESAGRIEGVLTGTKKGGAGENILGDMLRQLPTSIVECNLSISGKPVEYAIVLPNGKKLALDCKFPASDILQSLALNSNGQDPSLLKREMERKVMAQVETVRKYIDPSQTMDFALMSVPDSAFSLLTIQKLYQAYRRSVLILSYSMTIPYLLSLYQLCLQYSTKIDSSMIVSALEGIERHSLDIRDELENKLIRGNTMISNAYGEINMLIGRIESEVQRLKVVSNNKEDVNVN